MSVYGVSGCLASMLVQKISTSRLKNIALTLVLLADAAIYMSCYYASFEAGQKWQFYVLTIMQGVTLGVLLPITNSKLSMAKIKCSYMYHVLLK